MKPSKKDGLNEGRKFMGEIVEVLSINKFRGEAIVVNEDPRWVIRVSKISSGERSDKPAEIVAYAIHSPILTFIVPAQDLKGRIFKFEQKQSVINGVIFNRLEVTPIITEGVKTNNTLKSNNPDRK